MQAGRFALPQRDAGLPDGQQRDRSFDAVRLDFAAYHRGVDRRQRQRLHRVAAKAAVVQRSVQVPVVLRIQGDTDEGHPIPLGSGHQTPVSYTHLVHNYLYGAYSGKAVVIANLVPALTTGMAVSYTHLDVYKRQAIGYGGVLLARLMPRVKEEFQKTYRSAAEEEKKAALLPQQTAAAGKKPGKPTSGVIVEGLDSWRVKFAKCCNPLPGDPIVGFITRGYGVSIHKQDCVNAVSYTHLAAGVRGHRPAPAGLRISL